MLDTLLAVGLLPGVRPTRNTMLSKWFYVNLSVSLEIVYLLARGSFSWLFTVDDLIMVVPYFWAYKLAQDNDVSV